MELNDIEERIRIMLSDNSKKQVKDSAGVYNPVNADCPAVERTITQILTFFPDKKNETH